MKTNYVAICFLLIVFFLNSLEAQNNASSNYQLLWKIEGNGLSKPSYLFGTMHVKDNRAYNFSDSVMTSIQKTEVFALEVNPDSLMNYLFSDLINQDTVNVLKNELDEKDYEKLKDKFAAKNGYDLEQLKSKNPIVIRSLLKPNYDRPDDRQTFIDGYLYGMARTFGKEIIGLENAKTQADLFFGTSKKAQNDFILNLVKDDTVSIFQRNLLVETYRTGDLEAIDQLLPESAFDSIMIGRNEVMVNSITKVLEEKSIFAAVGAAHLIGENGVISMLRKKGYTLTAENASFTGVADQYKIDIPNMKWYQYEDEQTGLSIEIPGKPISTGLFEKLGMKIYPDISSETFYILYTMDLRESKGKVDEDKIVKGLIENYQKSQNSKMIRKKRIDKDGSSAVEIIMRTNNYIHMRGQFIVKNNILYGLMAGGTLNQLRKPIINRFFDSFKASPPAALIPQEWVPFADEKGAFSTYLPVNPTPKVSKVANPLDEDAAPFEFNFFISPQLSPPINYFIVYNDFPVGYYLENRTEAFSGTIKDLASRGTLLSDVDTIWLDGVEGREATLMLADQYYTKIQFYIRGNRVYKLFKQNLLQGVKELPEDDFFSSFSFTPYQESTLDTFVPEDSSFSVDQFPLTHFERDTTRDFSNYLNGFDSYLTTNPNSGGVYITQKAYLDDYFRIQHLDTFYANFIDVSTGWQDSVINNDSIMVGQQYGRDFAVQGKYNKSFSRYRVWLDGKTLYLQMAFLDKDELYGKDANRYFQSFKQLNPTEDFDFYSSKTKAILEGLSSEDTSELYRARAAVNYHYFNKEDLPLLYEEIKKEHIDDSSSNATKATIIDAIVVADSADAIEAFEQLYQNPATSDAIKSKLLAAFISMEEDKGIPAYLRNFLENPPQEPQIIWSLFYPLRDSLDLVAQNFDQLMKMMDHEQYKKQLLQLTVKMCKSDSVQYREIIQSNVLALLANVQQDLEMSIQKHKEENYYYPSELNSYLSLMYELKTPKATVDQFTQQLKNSFENKLKYLKAKAIAVRIVNDLEVDKKSSKELLSSMEQRYSLLKAYEDANRLSEVPKKYLSKKEVARLIMFNYLNEDYDYPDKIELTEEITRNDSSIYVFKFNYEGGDGTEYIGIAGPFSNSTKAFKLEEIKALSNWDLYDEKWRENAKALLDEMKNEALE